jgi:hypothetical protein
MLMPVKRLYVTAQRHVGEWASNRGKHGMPSVSFNTPKHCWGVVMWREADNLLLFLYYFLSVNKNGMRERHSFFDAWGKHVLSYALKELSLY